MNGEPQQERPDDLESAIDKEIARQSAERSAARLQKETTSEVSQTLNVESSVLRVADDPVLLEKTAARLEGRHNAHLISQDLIKTLLDVRDKDDKTKKEAMKRFWKRANDVGFFLMQYCGVARERLQSQSYVIAEASYKQSSEQAEFIPAADCQCALPEAKQDAEPVVALPNDTRDIIIDQITVSDMRKNPWKYGEVKDIVSEESVTDKKLAGSARRCAFRYIAEHINPQRGEFPVEKIAASIGIVTGIELPDGERIDIPEAGIKNNRSIAIHYGGSHNGSFAYILRGDKIPVEMGGETYQIIVDWMMCIQDIA